MAAKHPASSAPGDAAAGSSSSSTTALNPGHNAKGVSKRARGFGTVTQNACNECRKKRAKCDGQNPCARCKSQGRTECKYEAPLRQTKEALRKEVEALKRSHDTRDHVLTALVRPNLTPDVLMRLRNGQSVESISEWLRGASHSRGNTAAGALPLADNCDSSSTPSNSEHLRSVSYSSGRGSCGPSMAGSRSPISPMSSHRRRKLRHDDDPGSPWPRAVPSLHDYALSATSDSQPDAVCSTTDTTPLRQMVDCRHESVGANERQRLHGPSQVAIPEIPDGDVHTGTWTRITDDLQLVQHLLALYFCWEYPIFAPLSKEHFLKAFQNGDTGHCSSMLVNAILAVGCRFSTQPRTRANPDDPSTSGDHFFEESRRLFDLECDHHKLTTIQALGLLSGREASCGRNSESRYYAGLSIRLAVEMDLDQNHGDVANDDEETVVKLVTFWGAFTSELVWCLATGSLPQCSISPHLPPKPTAIDAVDGSLWIPYTDDGAPLNRPCAQVSNIQSVFQSFCKLSEIVHQSLYILYSPGKPLTSRELIDIYNRYINWYDEIPEVLRLGVNFTPAVIFVHMYYHFAILVLFRHFIKLRITGSVISPREVCLEAAEAIQGLSRSYSQLYTLKRTPSLTPYFVLMSSTIHLTIAVSLPSVISPSSQSGSVTRSGSNEQSTQQKQSKVKVDPRSTKAIRRGIEDLHEMVSCHAFAEEAISILLHLAKKWQIDVEIKEEEAQDKGGLDSSLYDAPALTFSRHGVQPVTDKPTVLAPHVKEQSPNWLTNRTPRQPTVRLGWRDQATEAWSAPDENEAIMPEMVENSLLWPFPMRRRPMLPAGDKLREAGFELLPAWELARE